MKKFSHYQGEGLQEMRNMYNTPSSLSSEVANNTTNAWRHNKTIRNTHPDIRGACACRLVSEQLGGVEDGVLNSHFAAQVSNFENRTAFADEDRSQLRLLDTPLQIQVI
jgi:hypothetical protein